MIALRLPGIIGYWLMSISLYWFISRRTSISTGIIALLFPFLTRAFEYAYEARPYGVVLGFSGLSLLCWQLTGISRYKKPALAGLFLSLVMLISSHYYAVLILLPLAIGEFFRAIHSRRLDPSVWIIFLLSLIPLIAALPLIQAMSGLVEKFWAKPQWISIGTTFIFLMQPAVLPLTSILIALLGLSLIFQVKPGTPEEQQHMPVAEIIATLGFCMLPIIGVILGKFVTGAFSERYVLSAVIGISVAAALLHHQLVGSRSVITLAVIVLFLCSFVLKGGAEYIRQTRNRATWIQICNFLESESKNGLPLVSWHSNGAVELSYYCSPQVASNIFYLADPSSAQKYIGHSTIDRGLLDLKPWFPVRVEPYETFVRSNRQFFIFGFSEYSDWNWLFSKLLEDEMQVMMKARLRHDFFLYRVASKDQKAN